MSMTLSGNGTITGLVSGGLPDGTVLPADLSTGGPYWDTSGNLGIGTASPTRKLHVVAGDTGAMTVDGVTIYQSAYFNATVGSRSVSIGSSAAGAANYIGSLDASHPFKIFTYNTAASVYQTVATFDNYGNLQFNSGYGSVATAYGCRAWVNFNGTGTVAIRASGNVSSITDVGTGQYRVNLTTALPDANFCAVGSTLGSTDSFYATFLNSDQAALTTSTVNLQVRNINSSVYDSNNINVAIFR